MTDGRGRPSRREVLAALFGAGAALGVNAAVGGLIGQDSGSPTPTPTGTTTPTSEPTGVPGDIPYLVGRPEEAVPSGVVRADLRAFKQGTGADYSQAFADALAAADAIYVPPGVWPTDQTIEVPAGKVLWSDGGYDRQDDVYVGAIVRSATSMPATVRLTGEGATIAGVNVDGDREADAALEFAADSVNLVEATARNGKQFALKATANFCTIEGGLFQQPTEVGNAMYQSGSDLIMWGARVKKGDTPLVVTGSGGLMGLLHITGKTDPASPSSAVARVSGLRNQFVNVFYDSSIGPSLILEAGANGNRFIGMIVRNSGSDGTFPVIRLDARNGTVANNRFDGFHTDIGRGTGWTFLLEMLGSPDDLNGNQLGSGYADGCDQLWNVRPVSIGDISLRNQLTRNEGSAEIAAGSKRLGIAHGLVGTPASISVTPSRGGTSGPDVEVGPNEITLTWTTSPGALIVYWRASM